MKEILKRAALATCLFAVLGSCASRQSRSVSGVPDDVQGRKVILFIPGLYGSRLADADTGDPIFQVGSSRVDLQACKLEYSIVSPK